MRFMTWCCGLLVLFAQRGDILACGRPMSWQWYGMLFAWFLVGAGALTVAIVRVVSAKLKAGTLSMPGARHPGSTATGGDD